MTTGIHDLTNTIALSIPPTQHHICPLYQEIKTYLSFQMDAIFAFKGSDFVLIAADVSNKNSIFILNEGTEKLFPLPSNKTLALTAEGLAEVSHFGEDIRQNVKLQEFRLEHPMSVTAVGSYIRNRLAHAIREHPIQVFCILAGFEHDGKPSVRWLDYLGTEASVDFAAQGYASYFLLSLFDANWHEGMTQAEAMDLAALCLKELQRRFLVRNPRLVCQILHADGSEATTQIIGSADDAYIKPL